MRRTTSFVSTAAVATLTLLACSVSTRAAFEDDKVQPGTGPGTGFDNDSGTTTDDDRDPVTCEEAARARSYVGCDYWATVTGNIVADIFDFTVVVSNIGQTAASVKVTGWFA